MSDIKWSLISVNGKSECQPHLIIGVLNNHLGHPYLNNIKGDGRKIIIIYQVT